MRRRRRISARGDVQACRHLRKRRPAVAARDDQLFDPRDDVGVALEPAGQRLELARRLAVRDRVRQWTGELELEAEGFQSTIRLPANHVL
jgi:hypothetical protein